MGMKHVGVRGFGRREGVPQMCCGRGNGAKVGVFSGDTRRGTDFWRSACQGRAVTVLVVVMWCGVLFDVVWCILLCKCVVQICVCK